MALIPVYFEYITGLRRRFLLSARLTGGWNDQGHRSDQWTFVSMTEFTAEDGCPAFRAAINLDDSQIGQTFRWGVNVDTQQRSNVWGIPTEVNDVASTERYRSFTLCGANQIERYYLTHCRRLGANKLYVGGQAEPAIRFAVWAPNAQNAELVMGERSGGYIWSDSRSPGDRGITAVYPMSRREAGIWQTEITPGSPLARFADFDHQPYMFRITRDDSSVAYRTDLYSRCQIGSGDKNPENPRPGEAPWNGTRQDLDGSKSCSVVVDPERVTELFAEVDGNGQPVWPETRWLSEQEFWQNEFSIERPLPTRLEDLVIYELHVHGLGLDREVDQGTLEDAMHLLDYLVDLGVNAIELMPTSEFQGRLNWGYSTSHYMAIEYSGGGRDQFKHFVRACHRRGIAVILDVVYNHYTFDAERAEWAFDSNAPENNIYYWYEGRASDWPNANGGYIDNGSSGWAPRFWDEMVRKMFISSAAMLMSEFHFDGFRVDLTTAIHRDTVAYGNGRPITNARFFGQKFLREWTRTLRLIGPNVFLIAEDHSGWSVVTQLPDQGGLGFDAIWYAEYYHHLIGDAQNDPSRARLLKMAGYGDDRELRMTWFASALVNSGNGKVIYHESHDEAGNSYYEEGGQRVYSGRTIAVAVNDAALIGETRRYAEARVHFAAGITLLAPNIPLFFMGEEVGASRPYRYTDFANTRENFYALRQGAGANLFRFYQDLLRLRLSRPALRSCNIDILHTHDANRILAFRRWQGAEELLVIGSLNNRPFTGGYCIQDSRITDGQWREILNSDATNYGGRGLINPVPISSQGGAVTPVVPANSVLVFVRQ
jgi:1,4-alpha-glucan branching enzyme